MWKGKFHMWLTFVGPNPWCYCIPLKPLAIVYNLSKTVWKSEVLKPNSYLHVLGELGCLIVDVSHSNPHCGCASARDLSLVYCHHNKLVQVVWPLVVQRPGRENGPMRGNGEVWTQGVVGQFSIFLWVAVISWHWKWENKGEEKKEVRWTKRRRTAPHKSQPPLFMWRLMADFWDVLWWYKWPECRCNKLWKHVETHGKSMNAAYISMGVVQY